MKKIDVLVVRFLPFILYLLFGIILLCVGNGVDVSIIYELHGNSVIYALSLFLISLSNNKYHCVWNRAMYVFLIAIPLLNFLDATFDFIPTTNVYITIIRILYGITAIITAYLAVRHFVLTIIKKHYARNKQLSNPNNERSHSGS